MNATGFRLLPLSPILASESAEEQEQRNKMSWRSTAVSGLVLQPVKGQKQSSNFSRPDSLALWGLWRAPAFHDPLSHPPYLAPLTTPDFTIHFATHSFTHPFFPH